jgi:hypothetical protein
MVAGQGPRLADAAYCRPELEQGLAAADLLLQQVEADLPAALVAAMLTGQLVEPLLGGLPELEPVLFIGHRRTLRFGLMARAIARLF